MRFIFHPIPVVPANVSEMGVVASIEKYALELREFYDSRATWHRRLYRVAGILVILAGTGLPLLANLDYPAKSLVVSLAGTLVAVLTALHAFYRWDQSWVLLRGTESALTKAYLEWQTTRPDEDDLSSTQRFLELMADLRAQEAVTYFKDLPFPSAVPTQPTSR